MLEKEGKTLEPEPKAEPSDDRLAG